MEERYEETEVRLDEWCEGGLRQQRNDGGGCATMRERSREWRTLVHMLVNQFYGAIFAWHCVLSNRPPVLWWLSHGERRDAVT